MIFTNLWGNDMNNRIYEDKEDLENEDSLIQIANLR